MNGPVQSSGPGAAPGANGHSPHPAGVTLTAAMAAVHGAAHLLDYTRDPFLGYFNGRSPDELVPAGSLLDHPNVRRWFDLFEAGLAESLYTYQLPLSIASGPRSAALGEDLVMFSSYSYLGLIGHPRIATAVKEAVERYGTSTGGVRLLTGTLELHHELEHELAMFLGQEGAATFASGYDANIAAITSLFGPNDVALLDQYAHQSIHDGVRMAGCENRRFKHNDMEDLERRLRQAQNRGAQRILIAVDSVFSMDGDQAPIADLIAMKKKYGAFLLVDEAHALGSVGHTGRGICEEQGIDPSDIDILTGSLSKGIPSSGGFVAGSRGLKIYIQHGSAPYMFSAAMTPANAAASLEAIRIVQEEPHHMERLRRNTTMLKDGLTELGFDTGASTTPVVPLLLGDEFRAYRVAREMLERGIFVSAVVFPAVSPGQARLRLCATAAHEPEHFERLFTALSECEAAMEVAAAR
ncbi:MAG TPA: aminotransferase class I/II-fold pyridoxal phosphate-dependent enzyme [Longimicrobiales bacterium]|nr:aminotransferase class I/II-fold pyridoxal phosphate-dependent enzyme [Longimicrobiales bacterium]